MIAAFLEFFALGAIGFWILLGVLSIVIVAGIENEKAFIPTLILLVCGLVYWKQLVALEISFRVIGLGFLVYVASGVLASFYFWNKRVRELVDGWYQQGITKKQIEDSYRYYDAISLKENKSRIIAWITYWPWSLLWHFTDDFFKGIYESLTKVYQKITDRQLKRLS